MLNYHMEHDRSPAVDGNQGPLQLRRLFQQTNFCFVHNVPGRNRSGSNF